MIHLIPLLAILPLLAFWLWMFSAMTKDELLTSEQKSNWSMAFVFLNVFAAAWYYLTLYDKRG